MLEFLAVRTPPVVFSELGMRTTTCDFLPLTSLAVLAVALRTFMGPESSMKFRLYNSEH